MQKRKPEKKLLDASLSALPVRVAAPLHLLAVTQLLLIKDDG
jgi:hypothetical protein